MTQEFTFRDIACILDFVTLSELAEHDQIYDILATLDFTDEAQARMALRRWLLPVYHQWTGRTAVGRARTKIALKVAMSRWGFLPYGSDLPGIDEFQAPYRSEVEYFSLKRQFFRWVWDELFHEPFMPLQNTDSLLERSDTSFINAPNDPQRWGPPTYRSLRHWDEYLRNEVWRWSWPAKAA